MTKFRDFLNEQLKDEGFRKEYEALEPEFAVIQAMIDARRSTGLTQKELSERTGIAQGDISKLENGSANPSLRTLQRLAEGLDMRLKVEFIPLKRALKNKNGLSEMRAEIPNALTEKEMIAAEKRENMYGPFDTVEALMEALDA
ncbi:MAG: helix-turn-helix domain-containing protein [Bacteroides sp.]|nr:helix-turn-helix domain-containing protein [Bacteroides sp.]